MRTFFKVGTICSLLAHAGLFAANVTGKVELQDSRNAAVRQRKDFGSVVVSLQPVDPAAPVVRPVRAEMMQRAKTFLPHVLAIPAGSVVDFPNIDPIFHNAFSNYSGQIFDVGLYAPGTTRAVTFRREGVVRVFCNIHPHMSAVIVVLRTPWFAVTEADGSFRLANVEPGDYRLEVFHERATESVLRSAGRRVQVSAGDLELPVLRLSEAGYLPTAHKNKFGKEYPPAPDAGLLYPGGAKK